MRCRICRRNHEPPSCASCEICSEDRLDGWPDDKEVPYDAYQYQYFNAGRLELRLCVECETKLVRLIQELVNGLRRINGLDGIETRLPKRRT